MLVASSNNGGYSPFEAVFARFVSVDSSLWSCNGLKYPAISIGCKTRRVESETLNTGNGTSSIYKCYANN